MTPELPGGGNPERVAAALAHALHRYLTGGTELLECRYVALLAAAGSGEPERHARPDLLGPWRS
ncbi:hypothetical protein [Streptomyces sp. NPDC057428]|uniref:hypothetical protein n=1 Tax=Streptomyces sp. NPDC057428 TaxID=3346129 RepID=UPI0036B7C5E8